MVQINLPAVVSILRGGYPPSQPRDAHFCLCRRFFGTCFLYVVAEMYLMIWWQSWLSIDKAKIALGVHGCPWPTVGLSMNRRPHSCPWPSSWTTVSSHIYPSMFLWSAVDKTHGWTCSSSKPPFTSGCSTNSSSAISRAAAPGRRHTNFK